MNNEQLPNIQQSEEETSIDFGHIFRTLLKHKRLYYKSVAVAVVLVCIYTLSLPNYYTCEVLLAPEMSTSRTSNSLTNLANQFGLKLGTGLKSGTEALYPSLYPDLMNSVDFKASLFPIKVHREGETEEMTYYDYLAEGQKRPWWSEARKWVFNLFSEKKQEDVKEVNTFRLTKKQTAIAKVIAKKVVCDVDQKTMVITIKVTDQDPLIAATMADSVKERLQDFITEYRTSKARVDLEYNQKLCEEAKQRYDKSRRLYAEFADANQDIILESVRTKLTDLENEMQLQFNNYNGAAAQLIAAEAKVQEDTPAFTTLQSATVPIRKAGPARAKMVLLVAFLVFLATSVYVLYKEDELKPLLGLA